MTKRLLSLLLALATTLALAAPAFADDVIDSGSCGEGLIWSLNSAGVLTVSGSGAMADYPDMAAPWFKYAEYDIKKIVIESGVTSIGDYAFYNCYNLRSVTVPAGVTAIGTSAFAYCGMSSVTLPASLTYIGESAFSSCRNLSGISIPAKVTAISYAAFYHCGSLASITLPEGLASIGAYAFEDCSKLTGVTLPASVTGLDMSAFRGCGSLTAISVAVGNRHFRSDSGVLFNADKTELLLCPAGKAGAYTVPAGVTAIGSYAFYNCAALSGVTLPDTLRAVGAGAFYGCGKLGKVTIPANVTGIGDFAFFGCAALSGVSIGSGVKEIGAYAFYGCGKLTNVKIPANVAQIGADAFFACGSLRSLSVLNPNCVIGSAFEAYENTLGVPGQTTISGYADSTAQAFAKEHGYPFNSLGPAPLDTPSNLKAVAVPGGVKVSWGKVSGAELYRLFYIKNGKWTKLRDTTDTSVTLKSSNIGKTYTYTVRCLSADGSTYTSSYDKTGVSVTLSKLATPSGLKAVNVDSGVKVSWSKVSGAELYRLFYIKNGKWVKLRDTTDTSVTLKSKNIGKTYTYTVRCLSADGKKYTSDYDKTGVSVTLGKLDTPSGLKAVNADGGIKVSWSKVSGAELYRLFYIKNGKWVKLRDTTDTSVTIPGGKIGKTYTYTVRCVSADGKSYTSSYDKAGVSITKK